MKLVAVTARGDIPGTVYINPDSINFIYPMRTMVGGTTYQWTRIYFSSAGLDYVDTDTPITDVVALMTAE